MVHTGIPCSAKEQDLLKEECNFTHTRWQVMQMFFVGSIGGNVQSKANFSGAINPAEP